MSASSGTDGCTRSIAWSVFAGKDGDLFGVHAVEPIGQHASGVVSVKLHTWCPECRAPHCGRGCGELIPLADGNEQFSAAVDEELVSAMTALLPLAYGYLRDDLIDDGGRAVGEDTLRAAARSLGFELATVFHEPPPQGGLLPPAFADLINECRRAAAHTVITLQGHLSNMSISKMVLREVLHIRAEAVVHEVGN